MKNFDIKIEIGHVWVCFLPARFARGAEIKKMLFVVVNWYVAL